jgi:1-acyl-sn-glycerol-3-phosphate acyltransferase
MYKTIQWFAYLWFHMLLPRPRLIWLRLQKRIKERDTCANEVARNWARKAIAANGSKIKIFGIENVPTTGGVLFISNHQSNFDIPIFIGFIPRDKGFIAKVELMKVPVFRMWMKALGCIIVNRHDARQSLLALNLAAERLKEGHSLVVFPEGTRSSDGKLGHFKSGGFKLAFMAEVPIVPLTINGSMDIMPKGTSLIKSAEVEVIISPPVFPQEEKDIHDTVEKVRGIILSNLRYARPLVKV